MDVSIIIPALDEATSLPATLDSLGNQQPAPVEIMVVDGGSTDATREIARDRGARVIESPPGRGRQLHTGAGAARGSVLLFLHADTILPPGALFVMHGLLTDPGTVGGRFRLSFPHRHPVLDMIAFLSRLPWTWTSYGDSAFFVRREIYHRIGGFEDVPLLEDVRFYRALKKRGRVHVIPAPVVTSCRRFCRRGPLRQLIENIGLVASHSAGRGWEGLTDRYSPSNETKDHLARPAERPHS